MYFVYMYDSCIYLFLYMHVQLHTYIHIYKCIYMHIDIYTSLCQYIRIAAHMFAQKMHESIYVCIDIHYRHTHVEK